MQKGMKRITIIGLLVALLLLCTGCGDDSYKQTLQSGMTKYYSGQPMTKQEYNAVKSFNNWKSNQGEKTYNQW